MVQRASIGESIMDSSKKQGLQQGFSGKKKKKKKKGIYEILLIVHTTVKLPRIEPDRADAGLSGPRKPVDKRQELVEAT